LGINYIFYVHKKNIGIYRVFLYISVDTESKRNLLGIFINCCRHRKNIGYIGYYLFNLCTQKRIVKLLDILYIVVDTERILDI